MLNFGILTQSQINQRWEKFKSTCTVHVYLFNNLLFKIFMTLIIVNNVYALFSLGIRQFADFYQKVSWFHCTGNKQTHPNTKDPALANNHILWTVLLDFSERLGIYPVEYTCMQKLNHYSQLTYLHVVIVIMLYVWPYTLGKRVSQNYLILIWNFLNV